MSTRDEQVSEQSENVPAPVREHAYDLVAIDIDGTLVTSANKLSVAVAASIRETQARGVGVTLVSGRPKVKVAPLLQELGLMLPYISSGGAHIIDPSNNLVMFHRPLERAAVAAIVRQARATQVAIIAQEPDNLYYEGDAEDLERLRATAYIDASGVGDGRVEIFHVEDTLQACAEPTKMTIWGSPDNLLAVEKGLGLLNLSLYITYSEPTYLEITHLDTNKGEALKLLARYLSIPLERVLVIGDSRNDVSMFLVAGTAVAMGNASELVKAAAHLVAPSNDEDGVAWVLRELVLKGGQSARPL